MLFSDAAMRMCEVHGCFASVRYQGRGGDCDEFTKGDITGTVELVMYRYREGTL